MKRELKFRFWDGKRFIKDKAYDVLGIDDEGTPFYAHTDSCESPVRYFEGCIVEQFTGLRDYSGKDIYEGDIVVFTPRTANFLHKGYCQEPFTGGQKFIVKWLESGFTLTDPKIRDSVIPSQVGHVHNYDFWNNAKSLDIIGNIHDTPELLE